MGRLAAVFLGLAVLVIVPFLLVGEPLERALSGEAARDWLLSWGSLAWVVGLGLLVADLVLPVPGTAVMAALGMIYGGLVGGAIGLVGSATAGLLGYGLCRGLGRTWAPRLLGEDGLAQGRALFARFGSWIVLLSRWLPLLPEVVACMAGLIPMPLGRFVVALLLGTAPMAFTFATIGALGVERPAVALAVSALLPPLLWLVGHRWLAPRASPSPDAP